MLPSWVYLLTLMIEIILIAICVVCDIMEVIHPETQAFEKVRVFVFLTTLLILPIVFQFLGLFFDFSIFWEFIKDVPALFVDMIEMFTGCFGI